MDGGMTLTIKERVNVEDLGNSWQFLQPSVPILVTSRNPNGSINVAPFGWVQPASVNPPLVCLALGHDPDHKGKSLANIEREKQFVINIPSLDIAEKLVKSSHWVFTDKSKMEITGFTPLTSKVVNAPAIAEAIAHLECEVEQLLNPGDHTIIIARVVAAAYDADAYTHDFLLKIHQVKPCIHMKQYNREIDQVHTFLEVTGFRIVEVPFAGQGNVNLFEVDPGRARQLPNKSGGKK